MQGLRTIKKAIEHLPQKSGLDPGQAATARVPRAQS
jgi:hypothetical protein